MTSYQEPEQSSYGEPAAPVESSYSEPEPPGYSPQPSYEAEVSGYEEDSYGAPAAPVVSYQEEPEPSYGIPAAPAVSYEDPQPSYGAPPPEQDGYGIPEAPAVSYEEPQPVYDPPQPVYSEPEPAYQQPEEDSYGAPAAPVVSYQESQPTYSAPSESGYSSPTPGYSPQPTYEEPEDDSYGAPAAPVESYRPPRESSYDEIDDAYGAPAAPVISYTPQEPTYHPAPPPPPRYRPKRKLKPYKRKPWNSYFMRKPKRHIPKAKPLKMMSMFHMPMFNMLFRMPRFTLPRPRLPPINVIRPTFPGKKSKPEPEPSYTKQKKKVKLEYSGWTPIESAYSPSAPEYEGPEPEIITIDNAHQHTNEYNPPQTYAGSAPEPITAKPSAGDYHAPSQVIYGAPEVSYQATYEVQESAPIEEPLFEYGAPIQDLNSLAEVDDYSAENQQHQYQSTHQASHLAQDVQSGSVYVQPEQEIHEEDQDLFYIFYDKAPQDHHKAPQETLYYQQRPYSSSPNPSQQSSSASFSLHVNGQSHGFSHSLDHS